VNNATKRTILRSIHLIVSIPIVGYLYSPLEELPKYAPITRYIAFPIILLTGLWMYAGLIFALLAVAIWLGVNQLFGCGAAILSQVVLLIARKIWLVVQARQSKPASG
jgi:predicted tellurium resistance membrane protein TerC